MKHAQGACPPPAHRVRIVGDATRSAYSMCDGCITTYGAAPFGFTFVPANDPEWTVRAREARLPLRISLIAALVLTFGSVGMASARGSVAPLLDPGTGGTPSRVCPGRRTVVGACVYPGRRAFARVG